MGWFIENLLSKNIHYLFWIIYLHGTRDMTLNIIRLTCMTEFKTEVDIPRGFLNGNTPSSQLLITACYFRGLFFLV